MALEREIEFFEAHRLEWAKEYSEKFVTIQDDVALGFFDEWEQALKAAYRYFGVKREFLVKEVLVKDRVYFIGAVA
jgi:hypothetical protein